jgi:hypothetical protein
MASAEEVPNSWPTNDDAVAELDCISQLLAHYSDPHAFGVGDWFLERVEAAMVALAQHRLKHVD